MSQSRDQPCPSIGVWHGVEDRIEPDQGIAREVHLGDQPLLERLPEEREVDVGRAPSVGMVPPRIGARLDRHKAEGAIVAGETPAQAREVGVEGRGVVVRARGIPAGGVGLPGLDQGSGTGRPSESLTRPKTMIRSPCGSPRAGASGRHRTPGPGWRRIPGRSNPVLPRGRIPKVRFGHEARTSWIVRVQEGRVDLPLARRVSLPDTRSITASHGRGASLLSPPASGTPVRRKVRGER